jgi:hypothetical protein
MINPEAIKSFEQMLSFTKRASDATHPEPMEYRYSFEDEASSWVKIKFCNYGEFSIEWYDDFVMIVAQKTVVDFAKQMKASLMQEGLPPVASEKRN